MSPVPKRDPGPYASVALPRGGGSGGPGGAARGGGGGGERGRGARAAAPGVRGGRAGAPGRPGRRGRRAALTRCCCRLLTATAAADAALCRSSAACPGRSRLRVNLRVRSLAIARRGPGARVPPVFPAPTSSTHPPFRKRNSEPFPPSSSLYSQEAGFSLLHPHSPTPCSPPKLRGIFPNSALPRARAANSASGPGPAAAPLELGPRDARGAAPACAAPGLSWPPGAVPVAPGTGRQRGRARGGRREAPGGACPRSSCPFGGSSQGWRSGGGRLFGPDFPGLENGRGPSSLCPSILRTRLESGDWDLRSVARTRFSRSSLPEVLA